MRARYFLFGAILPLLVAADKAPVPLQKFTSQAGRFTVLLPGKPQEQKVPVRGRAGRPELTQYQYLIDGGTYAYLVSYQDTPELANANDEAAEQALLRGQTAIQAGFQGKLLSDRKIKLGKYPGREYAITVPALSGELRARMYLVNGRFFQVVVIGLPEVVNGQQAGQVLDSFALLPSAPEPPPVTE